MVIIQTQLQKRDAEFQRLPAVLGGIYTRPAVQNFFVVQLITNQQLAWNKESSFCSGRRILSSGEKHIAADEDYITEALDAGAVAGGEVRKVQCVPCTEVLDEGTIFDGNTTKFSDPEAHNRMWEGDNYEHYADIETHYATSNDDVTYSDYVPFVGTFQATKRYYKIKTVIKRHTSDAAVRIEEVATRILSSA